MCEFVTAALASMFASGGGAAAGASAAAGSTGLFGTGVSLGTALQVGGTALSAAGALRQGNAAAAAADAQARLLGYQSEQERAIGATDDQRARDRFRTEMRRQSLELAARGIDLSSPTAIALGEAAAREMSFESAAIRSGSQARRNELSATQRSLRAQRTTSLLGGRMSAAASTLTGAAEIWPELLA